MKLSMRDFYLVCVIASLIACLPMAADTFGRKATVRSSLLHQPQAWDVTLKESFPPSSPISSEEAKEVMFASLRIPQTPSNVSLFFIGTGLFSLIGFVRESVLRRRRAAD